MNRSEIEAKVKSDFAAALGTVITVTEISGYDGDDSFDVSCPNGVKVRVTDTPEGDILHWVDAFCDPYWNVEPVEPLPRQLRSTWVFGPSYEETKTVAA